MAMARSCGCAVVIRGQGNVKSIQARYPDLQHAVVVAGRWHRWGYHTEIWTANEAAELTEKVWPTRQDRNGSQSAVAP
jgi:hypothetical protein